MTTSADAVPGGALPLAASAPGKVILFGEHAVVYGRTAVALALSLATRVEVTAGRGDAPRYNGSARAAQGNPYLLRALARRPDVGPLDLRVRSELPRASGLGSSAAFTASLVATLIALRGGGSRVELARESFDVEREAQGLGSPVDTSAAVAGGLLAVGRDPPGAPLWELPDPRTEGPWKVARLPDPGWTWVVGYTGVPKDTADVVRRVAARLRRPDGPALLDRIAEVATAGARALQASDRGEVGRLLTENQGCLVDLDISHPRLDALVRAVGGLALGAKITGAGGGGSMVALSEPGREREVARAITRVGGVPFLVQAAAAGARLGPDPPAREG